MIRCLLSYVMLCMSEGLVIHVRQRQAMAIHLGPSFPTF